MSKKPTENLVLTLLLTAVAAAAGSRRESVIVIGAGISGISTANALYEAGIRDILILEGSSRIGGRMMKAELGGYTVEMGANWFYTGGPLQNPLASLANKTRLRTSLNDDSNITANVYRQEGGLFPKKLVDEVEMAASSTESFCERLSEKLAAMSKTKGVDIDVSVLEAQRLFGNLPSTPLVMVIDYYHNDYEEAEATTVTSLKHTYPRREFKDHGKLSNFVCDSRGFEELVRGLACRFSNRSSQHKILLNKVVKEIFYSERGVGVKLEDGSTYRAKYVVVSVSIGVLQSNLIRFTPTLPMWKMNAISEFDMSVYTKIFLKFPYKFWPTGPGTEFSLYAHSRRGYYPFWQHLENEYPGSNILFVTITSEESRRVEKLSNEAVQREAMDVLRKMYGDRIPNPEQILVPRWSMDRLYKGSYSNWPNGYTKAKHDQLKARVGSVYFTGEHTNSRYLGYATGAYLAGWLPACPLYTI
ncbi:unnamed protein product [Linum tenue]|uniref:Amine oxidase domain-containing protein n=3 Tax=Linum tenue TaxID=586396 RepID=A0AAV0IP41_9ROSI|nr:unnamed protein product [Linum tenue]